MESGQGADPGSRFCCLAHTYVHHNAYYLNRHTHTHNSTGAYRISTPTYQLSRHLRPSIGAHQLNRRIHCYLMRHISPSQAHTYSSRHTRTSTDTYMNRHKHCYPISRGTTKRCTYLDSRVGLLHFGGRLPLLLNCLVSIVDARAQSVRRAGALGPLGGQQAGHVQRYRVR